jgi:periplasmic mercuric ion binding protein
MKKIMKSSGTFILVSLLFAMLTGFMTEDKTSEVKIKTSAVCSQCKDRIEQGLAYEKGIKDVSLDVDTKIATVKYNPAKTNPDAIRKLISKLGYDADSVAANKAAYDKLPKCCKKDAEPH